MSSGILQIVRMTRFPQYDEGDDLWFLPGVNVIVGDKDSGKTKWLRMFDYLMGDPDPPERTLGNDLVRKYEGSQAVLRIDGREYVLKRRWKERGSRTKVFVDGAVVHADHFSEYMLKLLGIPTLRVPRGAPRPDQEWVELGWRNLLRHVYRQERFWNDFAQEQLPTHQHACLAQFLAVGEAVHPAQLPELEKKQRDLQRMETERDSYLGILQDLTKQLLRQEELSVAVTEASIASTEDRIKSELRDISARRRQLLDSMAAQQQAQQGSRYREMQDERNVTLGRLEECRQKGRRVAERAAQMKEYRILLSTELERNQRLRSSGCALADLRVTHCPVCDQRVDGDPDKALCPLCQRPYPPGSDTSASVRRLEFEAERLTGEMDELGQLIEKLQAEAREAARQVAMLDEHLHRLDVDLLPARQLAATLLPPDLALLDEEQGRLQEQLAQLSRVRNALRRKDELQAKIQELDNAREQLSAELQQQRPHVSLSGLGRFLEEGINDYMNALNADEASRWQHGPIRFRFDRQSFEVLVGNQPWNQALGATNRAMVLLAYHYALLSLVEHGRFNYPGIAIVDFPVELAEGETVADKENYLVKPFVGLCGRLGPDRAQFIAAGRSFAGLEGANRIELRMWTKAPDAGEDSSGLGAATP